jgi:hypothetical protein
MTTSGDTIYGGTSGAATRLPKGTDGQVLSLVSGLPAWTATGLALTLTTRGDTAYRGASAPQRLPIGTNGQVLTSNGTDPVWSTPTATAVLPVGMMSLFLSSLTISKWLKCDNSAVSRTTYSALFALIGTNYGAGDGSTTFNIPDSPITGLSQYYIYTNV